MIDEVDSVRFESIRARYAGVDPKPGSSKYLDIEHWMRVAVCQALHL
jgi:hypothetical protein